MRGQRLGFITVLALWLASLAGGALAAERHAVGAKRCKECHEAEYRVWEGTRHYKSYRTVHKTPEAEKILAAAGTGKSMKKDPVCVQCHYTLVPRKAGSTPRPRSGPSCESCHGLASEWLDIHKDFGGPGLKAENESPEHRAQRIAASRKAGLIWGFQTYDIAANCMGCHGLARESVDPATFEKMLAAGHPLKHEYELVRYSQGSVRHRFYPPEVTVNKEMSPPELARYFVVGQAAKLVSATRALERAPKGSRYAREQERRAADARKALAAVADEPAVAKLLAEPTAANGEALAEALKGRDLSPKVASLLPSKADYK